MSETEPSPGDQHNSAYQQVTRSQRRLTRGRRLLYRLVLPLAMTLVRLFWWSYRRIVVIGDEHFDGALQRCGAVIPVFWHQHLMGCVQYLLPKRARGLKIGFLISPSVDGEVPAIVARRLGGHVIRGSASYTGARALRDFYQALSKDHISPLISPDGPHGPSFVFKAGALLLAQLSGKPIVPIAYAADRAVLFRSWDRFVLPVPFSRIAVAVGEPMTVPRVIKPEELEALQRQMAQQLHELYKQARAGLKR